MEKNTTATITYTAKKETLTVAWEQVQALQTIRDNAKKHLAQKAMRLETSNHPATIHAHKKAEMILDKTQKAYTKALDSYTTLADTLDAMQYPGTGEPITLENLWDKGQASAYCTVKFLRGKAKSESKSVHNRLDAILYSIGKIGDRQPIGEGEDMAQTARLAMLETISEGETDSKIIWANGCKAVSRAMYQASAKVASKHIYMDAMADGGESLIVNVSRELAQVMANLSTMQVLSALYPTWTKSDRKIIHYLAKGYTHETIAKRMNSTPGAIRVKCQRLKANARKAYPNYRELIQECHDAYYDTGTMAI